MLKGRYDSKWKRIIVVGSEGIPKKVFELDRLGQLVDKFPKQPYRKNQKKTKKISSSQSCPFLAENTSQSGKDVVSKFIDAILKYNEKDMTMMKLCHEQQTKQLQLAKDAQALQKQEQPNLLADFDSEYAFSDSFSTFFDELMDSPKNFNDINDELFPSLI